MSDASTTSQALPGFEELVKTAIDRAGSQDLHDKRYTAATVLRDYPETFKSVAAAIFKYNLPNRVIRDLYRMNGATVKGIHDMVMGVAAHDARGGFLMKCRAASTRSIVISRLLDSILDKLDDPNVVADMTVSELTSILERLSPHEQVQQKDDAKRADVTVVEPSEDFESVINGLIAEKIRAPELAGDLGADDEAEQALKCSTGNSSTGNRSLQMSDTTPKNPINNNGLCNGLCKVSDAGADGSDSPASAPAAPSSAEGTPGAGGTPGASRAGGVK